MKLTGACFDAATGIASPWCEGAPSGVSGKAVGEIEWQRTVFSTLAFRSSNPSGKVVRATRGGCSALHPNEQGYTAFSVSARDGSGNAHALLVAAALVFDGCYSPIDRPWSHPLPLDARGSLRVWLPLDLNDDIPSGRWKVSPGSLVITSLNEAFSYDVVVDHVEHERRVVSFDMDAAHAENMHESQEYTTTSDDKQFYLFISKDASIGGGKRKWYGTNPPYTKLHVSMQLVDCPSEHQYAAAPKTMPAVLRGQNTHTPPRSWTRVWPMNSGGGVHVAAHRFRLSFLPSDQPAAASASGVSGCTYATETNPIVILVKKWHDFDKVQDELPYEIRATY